MSSALILTFAVDVVAVRSAGVGAAMFILEALLALVLSLGRAEPVSTLRRLGDIVFAVLGMGMVLCIVRRGTGRSFRGGMFVEVFAGF